MQKLHLVGFTTDLDGLILGPRKGAKSGSFVVPLDERLLHTIEEALRLREEQQEETGLPALHAPEILRRPTRAESNLSVREIQDRLRAGESVDRVATQAGVDPEWIERFAAPVIAEQARVLDRARGMAYDKPRFGVSRLPLGDAVQRNIIQRGVRLSEEESAEAWSAYQVHDGLWGVRFRYVSRGRPQEAEWLFESDADSLISNNRLAAQLGYIGRANSRGPQRPAARKAPKRQSPRRSPVRKAAKKSVAKKAPARRSTTRKRPGKKSATKRTSARKATAKRRSPKKATPKKAAQKKAAKKSSVRQAGLRSTAAPAAIPPRPPRFSTPPPRFSTPPPPPAGLPASRAAEPAPLQRRIGGGPSVLLPVTTRAPEARNGDAPEPEPEQSTPVRGTGAPVFRAALVEAAAPAGAGERPADRLRRPRRRARPLRAR